MSDCLYNYASSRVCERGSKSCIVPHEPMPVEIVPGRTERCQIIIRGGRDIVGDPMRTSRHFSRGVDIQVVARGEDGSLFRLPCTALVLRVDGRRAIATVNLLVDEVEITGIEVADKTSIGPTERAEKSCCPECEESYPVDPEIAISRTKTKDEREP